MDCKTGVCYDFFDLKICLKEGKIMGNIVSLIMVVIMGLLGGIPTLYITLSIPVELCKKVYGKVKYGKSLYA